MSDIKREGKPDPLASARLRGRFEQERRVTAAERVAREALAGILHVTAELAHRCGDAAEAKARLTEAEAVLGDLVDGEYKEKLAESLRRARAAVEESANVCRRIPRE